MVGPDGHLVTAHWAVNRRLFVTIHEQSVCNFIDLKNQRWVVGHIAMKSGSVILVQRYGTDDIKDNLRDKTYNEVRKRNSSILMNNTLIDFPMKADQETYRCSLFCLIYKCGNS